MSFFQLYWIIFLNVLDYSLIFQLVAELCHVRVIFSLMFVLELPLINQIVNLIIEHYSLFLLWHSKVKYDWFGLLLAIFLQFIVVVIKFTKSHICVLL